MSHRQGFASQQSTGGTGDEHQKHEEPKDIQEVETEESLEAKQMRERFVHLFDTTRAEADEKILCYKGVFLKRSDIWLLNGPYFLNERIIAFYFSYLSTCYPSEDILLVPPGDVFCIKDCQDTVSLKDFLEPFHLDRRKLIIFPVSDDSNVNDDFDMDMADIGSHWSLLAFEKNYNVFVHHDSAAGGINKQHAEHVYNSIRPYVAPDATYMECLRTPRQENGYDCGLYVTAIARSICYWYTSDDSKDIDNLWFSIIEEHVTPDLISEMRTEIPDLVQNLMKK